MGKFVVVQRHPSNAFFMDFANTLAYDTPEQFLQALEYALASTPAPLSQRLFRSDEAREGIAAFKERRDAAWVPDEHRTGTGRA